MQFRLILYIFLHFLFSSSLASIEKNVDTTNSSNCTTQALISRLFENYGGDSIEPIPITEVTKEGRVPFKQKKHPFRYGVLDWMDYSGPKASLQGNIKWIYKLLGEKSRSFFGFEETFYNGTDVFIVPTPELLERKLLELNEILEKHGKDKSLISTHFFKEETSIDSLEYLKLIANKGKIPIGSGRLFAHDYSFHISLILFPIKLQKKFISTAQNYLKFREDLEKVLKEFIKKSNFKDALNEESQNMLIEYLLKKIDTQFANQIDFGQGNFFFGFMEKNLSAMAFAINQFFSTGVVNSINKFLLNDQNLAIDIAYSFLIKKNIEIESDKIFEFSANLTKVIQNMINKSDSFKKLSKNVEKAKEVGLIDSSGNPILSPNNSFINEIMRSIDERIQEIESVLSEHSVE